MNPVFLLIIGAIIISISAVGGWYGATVAKGGYDGIVNLKKESQKPIAIKMDGSRGTVIEGNTFIGFNKVIEGKNNTDLKFKNNKSIT